MGNLTKKNLISNVLLASEAVYKQPNDHVVNLVIVCALFYRKENEKLNNISVLYIPYIMT